MLTSHKCESEIKVLLRYEYVIEEQNIKSSNVFNLLI